MRTVEITRAGDASVTDQLAEMRDWLRQANIEPLELAAGSILQGRVRFHARFTTAADAARFRARFADAS